MGGSKFSMLSNVSSLVAGGVFDDGTDEAEERAKLMRSEELTKIGPEMGHINEIKNKAMRTEEFLKLQRQKRKAKMKARKDRKKARLERRRQRSRLSRVNARMTRQSLMRT